MGGIVLAHRRRKKETEREEQQKSHLSKETLVQDDPKTPPVHCREIAGSEFPWFVLLPQNFRGHVCSRACRSCEHLVGPHPDRHVEIGQVEVSWTTGGARLEMRVASKEGGHTMLIQKEIVRLNIPVNNSLLVQVIEGQGDLSAIEADAFF